MLEKATGSVSALPGSKIGNLAGMTPQRVMEATANTKNAISNGAISPSQKDFPAAWCKYDEGFRQFLAVVSTCYLVASVRLKGGSGDAADTVKALFEAHGIVIEKPAVGDVVLLQADELNSVALMPLSEPGYLIWELNIRPNSWDLETIDKMVAEDEEVAADILAATERRAISEAVLDSDLLRRSLSKPMPTLDFSESWFEARFGELGNAVATAFEISDSFYRATNNARLNPQVMSLPVVEHFPVKLDPELVETLCNMKEKKSARVMALGCCRITTSKKYSELLLSMGWVKEQAEIGDDELYREHKLALQVAIRGYYGDLSVLVPTDLLWPSLLLRDE